MIKNPSNRNPAMDVIRCFALCCVVWVHFYLGSSFYAMNINTKPAALMLLLRSVGMLGVTLFLSLSGYLMQKKTITLSYYKRILRVLCVYFLASACCFFYQARKMGQPFERKVILDFISALFSFQAAPYGWYVNMYCGLFLLFPYLNLLYHGLDTQKMKLGLLATMLTITALPRITKVLTYISGQGWILGNHSFQAILPDWWTNLFPFTCYFLGAYLRDYPLPIKPLVNFLLFVLSLLIPGAYTIYIGQGGPMVWGSWLEDGSLFTVIQAMLLFNLFAQGNYQWMGKRAAVILAYLSELTLGAYLVSWIFDDLFYPIYVERLPVANAQLAYAPVIFLAVLVCSLALSAVIQLVYNGGGKIFSFFCSLIPKRT